MNTLTSTSSKLSALAFSFVMTLSLAGGVVQSFDSQTEPAVAQLPTVVIIGHRDSDAVPDTLQADAKVNPRATVSGVGQSVVGLQTKIVLR